MKAYTEQVLGNTGCLFLRGSCIPFYRIQEKQWILMDSGSRYVREELTEYLDAHGIRIRAVLCSHAHYDHTENNRYLQETHGAEVIATALDAGILSDRTALKACFYCYTGKENSFYNKEMLCRADRIILPWESCVSVDEARFQIIGLPGHAASHIGFITPDRAVYLADSIFSEKALESKPLFYMLDWGRCLETMEMVRGLDYPAYIIAHSGIYSEIQTLAEKNLCFFKQQLMELGELFEGELPLDLITERAAAAYGFTSDMYEKVRNFERIVRSVTEYLLEQGVIRRFVKNGVIMYRKAEDNDDRRRELHGPHVQETI